MPNSAPHRVFRCTLEVQGVARASAEPWRRRARALWDGEFAPRLDAELGSAFPIEMVRFDRLVVELRVNERAETAEIGRAFCVALQQRLQGEPQRQRGAPSRQDQQAVVPEKPRDWLEVWLVTGLVPWWGGKPTALEIAERILEKLRRPSGPGWLRTLLYRHPAIARRLAFQFDDAWQNIALATVWHAEQPAIADALRHSSATSFMAFGVTLPTPDRTQVLHTRAEIWEAAWRLWSRAAPLSAGLLAAARGAAQAPDAGAVEPFLILLLHDASLVATAPTGAPASIACETSEHTPANDTSPSTLETPLRTAGISRTSGRQESDLLQGLAADAGGETVLPRADGQVAGEAPPPRTAAAALDAALSPGLPVVNAGLVLLAPFLPRFYEALGIRLSPDSHDRSGDGIAPLLLHLLATGSDHAAEHELALPKLLCGVPLDEPVACLHAFGETFLAEADRLLNSVIEHWPALKSTSRRGLRESFLQRGGLLRDGGQQWQLRVEHRVWDVLLDRAPWTFRTIRLPWMPRPLMVEWEAHA